MTEQGSKSRNATGQRRDEKTNTTPVSRFPKASDHGPHMQLLDFHVDPACFSPLCFGFAWPTVAVHHLLAFLFDPFAMVHNE